MSIVTNRKAYFDFKILQEFDCGVVLIGNEVKSIRKGDVTISSDSFVYLKDGEVWAKNIKVAKYKQSYHHDVHDDNRDKKLLLNKIEISKIEKLLHDNGTTIIPLSIFVSNNKIKIKIGVAKGKKNHDKRESIKSRDIDREMKRSL
jgi:SsrA-binding protein